jgi:hypothetical protein
MPNARLDKGILYLFLNGRDCFCTCRGDMGEASIFIFDVASKKNYGIFSEDFDFFCYVIFVIGGLG